MPKSISQKLSPNRHHPEWRVLSKTHARGALLPQHQHESGQLVFALSGVMLVDTGTDRWTIPPQRALWVPQQQDHAIQMLSRVELRTIYFYPALIAQCAGFARQADVHAITASPLIRELVLGLLAADRSLDMRALLARLLLHAVGEAACLPTHLPMPADTRLRAAALHLVTGNHWQMSLAELASHAALSERTVSRRFTAETGLSFRAWRQRARIIASLDLLSSGRSIKSIAHAMQFASDAAYVAAFRTLMGSTPHAFR